MKDIVSFPRFRAVADHALLIEFGETATDATHEQVVAFDAELARSPFEGFLEATPAYVNLLVCFDPMITDHRQAELAIVALLKTITPHRKIGTQHEVDICYEPDLAPDLAAVAQQTGLSEDAVVQAHLAATYHVVMYGFAPGYAYLGGGPATLHLPRKPAAKRGVASGSVIIAGQQCLVTTLTMPTGWWIIGRSPTQILLENPVKPFLFDVGDQVRFRRIGRAAFDKQSLANR